MMHVADINFTEKYKLIVGLTNSKAATEKLLMPSIRCHARDIYLGMCPAQNDFSYLNVLGCFSETSQTAVAKNN